MTGRPAELPKWAIKSSDLRKHAKICGIELHSQNTAQVLFRDFGEPIGSGFFRPLNLVRDGRTILSMFKLEHRGKNEYVLAPWYSGLKTYVADLLPEYFVLVVDNPSVHYIEGDKREELKKRVKAIERKEAWIQKSSSSLQVDSGWQPILSAGKKLRLPPLPRLSEWQRPLLEPERLSPQIHTESSLRAGLA